jgi:hypothetical protein
MSYPTPDQPPDWQAPADPYQTHGPPPPGYPGSYPPPYGYGYGYGYGVPMAQPTNPLAITSLVLSCVGVMMGITAPIGAVLGHVARRQIRQQGGQGDGLALAGIITGWIATGLWVLFVIAEVALIAALVSMTPPTGP